MTESSPIHQRPYVPPPGSVAVTLVRPGASAPVIPGQRHPMFAGQGNPALDPIGVEQAQRTAEALCEPGQRPIDAIYTSTLVRTQQTAEPLAERLGLTPIALADLREVYVGELEGGLLREAGAAGDPVVKAGMLLERWDTIPGAESEEAFSERLARGLPTAVGGRGDQRHPVVRRDVRQGRHLAVLHDDAHLARFGQVRQCVDDGVSSIAVSQRTLPGDVQPPARAAVRFGRREPVGRDRERHDLGAVRHDLSPPVGRGPQAGRVG